MNTKEKSHIINRIRAREQQQTEKHIAARRREEAWEREVAKINLLRNTKLFAIPGEY